MTRNFTYTVRLHMYIQHNLTSYSSCLLCCFILLLCSWSNCHYQCIWRHYLCCKNL